MFLLRKSWYFLVPTKVGILWTILIGVSICPFAIGSASAQENSRLDSLIVLALKNNPQIAMARYESKAAETRISVARQLPDPELQIAVMNLPTNFSLTSDGMTMVPQFTLMQLFPWFGKLKAAGQIEHYGYLASNDRLESSKLDVIANVKSLYASIYETQKTIELLKYKRELLRSVIKVAEQLFAVGEVPQQDVFRATADLTMIESDIIKMNSTLTDNYAKLAAIVGVRYMNPFQIDTLQLPNLDSLSRLQEQAETNNSLLSQIQNVKSAAEAKTIFARKDAIPDFKVGVSYGFRWALMPDGTKPYNMMNFELGMTLPIYFAAKQQKMIDEADYMKEAADEEYGNTLLRLRSSLRSSYANAEAQGKLLPLYSKELIPQYEATYNSSLSAYSVGKTTFAMLIDNLTTLINAKISLVQIESSYFSAIAQISTLTGDSLAKYKGVK